MKLGVYGVYYLQIFQCVFQSLQSLPLCVPYTVSDWHCGMERVRLPILTIKVHTLSLSMVSLHSTPELQYPPTPIHATKPMK